MASGVIYDTRESTLDKMITSIFEAGIVSKHTYDLMHRLRIMGNSGVHVDINDNDVFED